MRTIAPLVVLLLAMQACEAPGPSACTPYWPDIPVAEAVIGGSSRAAGARLVEVWRTGGLDSELDFSAPASIVLSHSGYTAVVDYELAEVNVIHPDGQSAGQWARKGRGPGELTMPVAATWVGDTLRVFDIEQAKVVSYVAGAPAGDEFKVAGAFVAPVVTSGEIEYVAVRGDASVLLSYPLKAADRSDSAVASVMLSRPGTAVADTLISVTIPVVTWGRGYLQPFPGAPRPVVAVGPDGWLALAAPDGSYRVLLRDPQDRPVHQICRPVPPPDLRRAEFGEGLQDRGYEEAAAALAKAGRAARLAHVGRLLVGSAGEIWVERARPAPFTNRYGVPGATFDVFDSRGRFVNEIKAPAGVMLQAVSGEVAIGLTFGEFDEPVIMAFRIQQQAP
jgi:hypothetical protein